MRKIEQINIFVYSLNIIELQKNGYSNTGASKKKVLGLKTKEFKKFDVSKLEKEVLQMNRKLEALISIRSTEGGKFPFL